MEILIVLLTLFLKEFVKNITKDLWTWIKKCIKKPTLASRKRNKGGKPK